MSSSTSDAHPLPARAVRESFNLLLSERLQDDSIPTTSVMSTSEKDPMLAMHRRKGPSLRIFKGPAIPGLNPRQRVGWIDRTVPPPVERTAPPVSKALICHDYYKQGHVAPDCVLSLRQVRQVITNYEALTPTKRISVPPTAYEQVCKTFNHGDFAAPSETDPSTTLA